MMIRCIRLTFGSKAYGGYFSFAVAGAVVVATVSCLRSASVPEPADTGTGVFSGTAESGTQAAGSYKSGEGAFRVEALDFELASADRNRSLPLTVRWPELRNNGGATSRPAAFPMVVFSHGAGGSSDAFPELSEHWAANGYVVVHPTHSDSVKLRRERGERLGGIRGGANAIVRNVKPEERVDDVKWILDTLGEIESRIAEKGGTSVRIDPERIAVAGQSAGALTTQMIAGLRFTGRGRRLIGERDFSDPRVRAAIVISGQGLGRPALSADSWSKIAIPMMVYAGSEDHSPVSDETPAGRRHPFEYAAPGDKYLIYIEGATHGSYQGKETVRILGETPPANSDYITDVVKFGTLAFLDAYLKGDAGARRFLASDAIATYPGGQLEYRYK